MSTTHTMSVAEAAGKLADNVEITAHVEKRIADSRLVTMLIQLRVEKKLTQKEIAISMGCSPSRISKLEADADDNLGLADIKGYLRATKTTMSIFFDSNRDLPAATKIKQHVFEIDDLLKELVNLASKDVGKDIVDKIHQFSGEVLMNFLRLFGNNYENLRTIVKMYSTEPETAALSPIPDNKPETCTSGMLQPVAK